jgi:multimeric flavodoxin WrbA
MRTSKIGYPRMLLPLLPVTRTRDIPSAMRNLVILGTAREDSHTLKAVNSLSPFSDFDLIDLRNFKIGHYNYDHSKNDDDFLKLAQKMAEAKNIIFATPVYWYAMSGPLKVFFDRLTELLSTHKEIGKSLKGKHTFLIATGSDPSLPLGFEEPFRLTSDYFGMHYQGSFYETSASGSEI